MSKQSMEKWASLLPKRLFSGATVPPNSDPPLSSFVGYDGFLRACSEDNDKALDHLLASCSNPPGANGDLPPVHDMLITAARSQSLKVLRLLLDPKHQETCPEMSPALHKAACEGGKDVYAIFLGVYPSILSLHLDDLGGPIPYAILENDALFLYYLLQQGFDGTCLDNLKSPPHSQSLQNVDQEVVDLLAEFGLSLENTNAPPKSLSTKDFDYRLIDGIHTRRASVLRYLLSRNPDWRMSTDENYWIYNRAGMFAKLPTFAAFIEHEPDLLDRANHYVYGHIWNIMAWSVNSNDVPYLKWLMDHGADPNKTYCAGDSMLSYAKRHYREEMEEMIVLLESYGATEHDDEGQDCIYCLQ